MRNYDVVIIGGGILGAMTARNLSRYRLRVLVVEKACDVGEGSTKANSGILYPGFHPRGGSLKGLSCVGGNALYDSLCMELGVSMKKIGSLYVAFHAGGEEKLREKYGKGLANGVKGMAIISGTEARRMEPLLSPDVTQALYAPNAGIISPFELILAVSRSALNNGVEWMFDTEVTGINVYAEGASIRTTQGLINTEYVVNTAGENAAVVESWVRCQDLRIKPRRGQYYIFDKQKDNPLKHVLFQAQENDEGGTLLAPTVEGNLIAGPTSEDVRSYRCVETTEHGLAHVERVAKKLVPELDMGKVIANFAGVRANISNVAKEQKDFVIRTSSGRVVSALGIKNPGMTAAPYLANEIVLRLREAGLKTEENEWFSPVYRSQLPFLKESPERQKELLAKDPRYAKVVCWCEGITEGDIIHEMSAPLPPKNFNGLKKRLRVGMGRCQGGFCTARIIEIMSREMRCRPQDVIRNARGSNMIKGRVKP